MFWILLAALTVLSLMIMAVRADISKAIREESVLPQGQCTPSRNTITHNEFPSRKLRWHGLERHVKEHENASRG
jgi:hypothetical protein